MQRAKAALGPQICAFGTAGLIFAAVASQAALAQTPVLQGVTGVQIEYLPPTDPTHKGISERLMKRQVLEHYQEFLSPLRLKRSLTIALAGCNGEPNAGYKQGRVTFCYELVADMERRIVASELLPGFRREDAIVGNFVSILLHETGHAIFDLLDIPIFGREEDAADAVAAYVPLSFGKPTARRILTGNAFGWRASELWKSKVRPQRTFTDYSDEHGTDAQRFFNTLCIALGSDMVERTDTFRDFIKLLPEHRLPHCRREYLHVKNSFARFVVPHIDIALLAKVRSTQWLRSEDGVDITPPRPFGPESDRQSSSASPATPSSAGPSVPSAPQAPTPGAAAPPAPKGAGSLTPPSPAPPGPASPGAGRLDPTGPPDQPSGTPR